MQQNDKRWRTPEGTTIYAIGDIHGRADLLRDLHGGIRADYAKRRPNRAMMVYLGDYVDRGPASREVIDLILKEAPEGMEKACLLGNHEDLMLAFLDGGSTGLDWLPNGGGETMRSYGVAPESPESRDELAASLPEAHTEFLRSLKPYHVVGDYLFVHAGIRPGLPLQKQSRFDLIWIRERFLGSDADHGRCVVHGHTIRRQVDFRPNRIGIDTGAFFTNKLTCLVLEGDTRSLIQTS